MAAATGSIASCKKLQAESEEGAQQQFYALVVTNAQQQTFDLAVTDGERAWRGTGLRVSRPPGFTADEAWQRALELLLDVHPSAKPAALKAQQLTSGELQFTWSWAREVGAGRHLMKLPDPAAAAAAGGGMLAKQQQQAAGVLLQQQPPHSTITHILDTLVTSYSRMQASLAVSSSAQSSLSSSLEVLRGQLDSQAAAHKERERELYLKFTMLLNQKTRQLQKEHEVVKQLAAELDRIKGEGEADSDDDDREHHQPAYPAEDAAAAAGVDDDTEPGSDDAPPAAAAAGRKAQSAAAAAAGGGGGVGSFIIPDSEDPGAGTAAAPSGVGGGGVVDLEAGTQLLPEELFDAVVQNARKQQ